ncbi:MAG: hypothetical protein QW273_01865, partial [Candidatus Pacearchaeota archaeon]
MNEKSLIGIFLVVLLLVSFSSTFASENKENKKSFFEKIFLDSYYKITGYVIEDETIFYNSSSEENLFYNENLSQDSSSKENISEELEENISLDLEKEINETFFNQTQNESIFNESTFNQTLNETFPNETINLSEETPSFNETKENESVVELLKLSSRVVVGQDVKWVRVFKIKKEESIKVDLPKEARDISIKTKEDINQSINEIKEYQKEINRKELVKKAKTEKKSLKKSSSINGNAIKETESISFFKKIANFIFKSLTGRAIYDKPLEISVDEESLKVDLSSLSSEEEILVEY